MAQPIKNLPVVKEIRGPNIPLQGRQGSWGCIPGSPGESGLVSRGSLQQIWKTQQWPQEWKKSVFIPIPKKGNAKE